MAARENKTEAACQHIWVYEGKQGSDTWKVCRLCGQTQIVGPYDPVPGLVAKELRIRHDNEDGDV